MDEERRRRRLFISRSSIYSRWRIFSTFFTGILIGLFYALLISNNWQEVSDKLFPNLQFLDQRTLVLVFSGILGGVIYTIVVDGKVEMPRFTTAQRDVFEAGLFGDILLGIAGAFVLDFLTLPIGLDADARNEFLREVPLIVIAAKGIIGGYGGKAILVFALEKVFKNIERLEKEKERYAEKSFQQKLDSIETVQLLDRLNQHLKFGLPDAELSQLQQEIRVAGGKVKQQLFNLAEDARSVGHLSAATLPRIQRTIPIFEALRDSDPKNPEYYAQLAYAYKDLSPPEIVQALQLINQAIELRDQQRLSPSMMGQTVRYELNRAILLIRQNYMRRQTHWMDTAECQAVIDDLIRVNRYDRLIDILQDAQNKRISVPIADWILSNQAQLEKRNDTDELLNQLQALRQVQTPVEPGIINNGQVPQTSPVLPVNQVPVKPDRIDDRWNALPGPRPISPIPISEPATDGIPQAAVDLIKQFEAFEARAYPDPLHKKQLPTIGYGTTRYPNGRSVTLADVVSVAQAEKYLSYELEMVCRPALERIPQWSQMNTNQRSALYSFAYNLGAGFYRGEDFDSITLVCDSPQRWDDQAWIEAQFVKYRNPGTKVEAGLRRRRLAEAKLFCQPVELPAQPGSEKADKLKVLEQFARQAQTYTADAIAKDQPLAVAIQRVLISLELLDPPADGLFGPISASALYEFQKMLSPQQPELADEMQVLGSKTAQLLLKTSLDQLPRPDLQLGNDLASRIIRYMQAENYRIFTAPQNYNIVYIEGMDIDGVVNVDTPNHFNDVRMVIEFQNGKPLIVDAWEATTEPGYRYTNNPTGRGKTHGAARIKFGQYKAWRVDQHCGQSSGCHEALVQDGKVTVHRDFNRDMQRTDDALDTGYFGINQHWGYDLPRNDINYASAGCLVGRETQGHREFMKIVKQDQRYRISDRYMFYTTIIPGDDLAKRFPIA